MIEENQSITQKEIASLSVTNGGKMFKLVSNYKPTGDQPEAIEYLSKRCERRQEIPDATSV